MELIQGLVQLGFSEYEARIYAALLAHPGTTGYEAAKRSGVPRAKVYEALESLDAKGAVQTSQEGERLLYHPLPHGTLLRRHLEKAEQVVAELRPMLEEVAAPEPEGPLITLRGYEQLLTRAEEIIDGARSRLFLSGWPAQVDRLLPKLKAAEARGVLVYVLLYGKESYPLKQLYHHDVPDMANRLSPTISALVVVADHADALLAEVRSGPSATGLWTRNQGVVLIAAEFIKHDIFLAEATRHFAHLPPEQLAWMKELQKMWFR